MEATAYVALLISVLLIAVVSQRIRDTIITVPMLCVALGLAIGPLGLGLVKASPENHAVRVITELTLIMVLASDASRIKLKLLRRDHSLPLRLLGFGLPLTMILGAFTAVFVFDALSFWEAAILAVILTPTDASLGQAVVSNPRVPMRIRQSLNIESGLNDGIAMPFLLLAISLTLAGKGGPSGPVDWLLWAGQEILFGVGVGLVVGFLGIKLTEWGRKAGWMASDYSKIVAIALPLLAYGVAQLVHGNGFLAAFILGATIGNLQVDMDRRSLSEHVEVEVELLIMLTFLLFGAVLLPPALPQLSGAIVLYAILSLTVVRMVSVGVSLVGMRVQTATNLFLGWFGPRGIASILYVYLVLDVENIANESLIYAVVMVTVLVSIFAHGLTAAPAARWYGRYMTQQGDDATAAELQEVSELPLRRTTTKSA